MSGVGNERGCVACVKYNVLESDTHNQRILSNRGAEAE
jgi:hypothetical protein